MTDIEAGPYSNPEFGLLITVTEEQSSLSDPEQPGTELHIVPPPSDRAMLGLVERSRVGGILDGVLHSFYTKTGELMVAYGRGRPSTEHVEKAVDLARIVMELDEISSALVIADIDGNHQEIEVFPEIH